MVLPASATGTETGPSLGGIVGAPPRGVYAGSTPLSFRVFGRHRRGVNPSEPCGFARLAASSDDNRSALVMMGSGSGVRVLAVGFGL
jgi:hypothetical protein